MTKAIVTGLVAFLTALGCLMIYQRETALLNNQVRMAQTLNSHEQIIKYQGQAIQQVIQVLNQSGNATTNKTENT